MIPLYHDFTDETVLVFGGGPVGARKARRFAAEARVVIVSPEFGDHEFGREEAGDVELVRARPEPEDVTTWIDRTAPALVVAATDDDEVNEAIARESRERGLLLNRADSSAVDSDASDDGPGVRDVVVPATVTDGDVRVAISTGGRSPALAKYLRERIEAEIEGAEAMASLTGDLRAELRERDVSPSARRDAIRAVVRDPLVWKALRTGESNPRREATRVIRNTTGGDRWTRE